MKTMGVTFAANADMEAVSIGFTMLMRNYLRDNGDEPFTTESKRLDDGRFDFTIISLSPEIQALNKEYGLPRHI